MSVEETPSCGISCGPKCSTVAIILSIFYMLICMAFSLTMRLYLKGFYAAAHISGLGVVVAVFVVAHHIFRVRNALGCGLKVFAKVQVVLNCYYLICSVVMTTAYIVIAVLSINFNFDYMESAVFSAINAIFLLYLILTVASATRADRYMDYEVDRQFVWHSDRLGGTGVPPDMELFGYPAYGDFGTNKTEKGSMGTNTSLVTKSSQQNPDFFDCKACCEKTCHILFGILYFFAHLILVIIFALSACHPAFIAADTFKYRNNADMYTVHLDGHQPLALFLKCRGQGNETLIYENGLGSEAFMAWHFIPRYLEDKYVVCVTDRRGYGWSETFEHDLVSLLADEDERQWTKTNSEFLVELLRVAEIKTPFYYMGHSYGGHHIVQVALDHPEMVKGLIFLDSAGFGITEVFETYGELASNFEALGIMYILTESNWVKMEDVLQGVVEYSVLPSDIQRQLVAAIRSGYYITSYYRELLPLRGDKFAFDGIRQALEGKHINTSAFVIDADNRTLDWFPEDHFPYFDASLHASFVPGSDHQTLVFSEKYGQLTSELIDLYIQYDTGRITKERLETRKGEIQAMTV